MTINFDPNVTTTNNNSNNEVKEMITVQERQEISFKSKLDIINAIKSITDDDFLTVQAWEFDAIKSIVAGKVTAAETVAKIGEAQTSNVFDNFLNNVIVVTTIILLRN